MQKWWNEKTDLHRSFLKRLLVTWCFTFLLVLAQPMVHGVALLSFIGLALFASYEFFKDWNINEANAVLIEDMNTAYAGLCETCPWVFMAKNGIKPPVDVSGERYKKGDQRGAAQQQPLPDQAIKTNSRHPSEKLLPRQPTAPLHADLVPTQGH